MPLVQKRARARERGGKRKGNRNLPYLHKSSRSSWDGSMVRCGPLPPRVIPAMAATLLSPQSYNIWVLHTPAIASQGRKKSKVTLPRLAERVPTAETNKLEHVPQEQNPRATLKLHLLVRHSCNGHQPVIMAQGTGTERLRPREMGWSDWQVAVVWST